MNGEGAARAAVAGTAAFVVSGCLSLAAGGPFHGIGTVVDLALFAAGCVAFASGYLVAVGRSRVDRIDLASLFFLARTSAGPVAPSPVRRALLVSYAVQIVTAIVVAAVGLSQTGETDFNAHAFAIMVPVFGQGMIALWAARFGTFPARSEEAEVGSGAGSDGAD